AYQLHLAALELGLASTIAMRGPEDIRSREHWVGSFQPFEHQVRNLITYCRRGRTALIADDVGLGKTISAALILAELRHRKLVQRTLVVAPRLLLPQWCRELGTKFGIKAVHATGASLLAAARSPAEVVVTTYESARRYIQQLDDTDFQMLVLDEAHKLRNLHGSPGAPPKVARVMREVLRRRRFPRVLMLTATPIQNRLWDLYALVDLLAVATGHANPLGDPARFAADWLEDGGGTACKLKPARRAQFQAVLSDCMVRTTRHASNLPFPTRSVKVLACEPGGEEVRLHRLVDRLVAGLPAFAQLSLMLALMSSPAALADQLDTMLENGSVDREAGTEVAEAARLASGGCKLSSLLELAGGLRAEHGPSWRMVVFTLRKATQEVIGAALQERGVRVGYIRGAAAKGNERAIERFCRAQPDVNVIVSTDAGAEGVNLQVANVVVNDDLPWTPMTVEQRIGRVQRLMSAHASVQAVNLVVAHSIEERVVVRLIQKLQAVSDALGDGEGILETAGMDASDVEDSIRQLVLSSLRGVDVERAMQQMEASIQRGKQEYDAQRATVARELGVLESMHAAGPAAPRIAPVQPRMSLREFVGRPRA
ncbi:MAG: DEAD/DEAH box helicase, partial [Planctomycetia bacterium]